MRWHKLAHRRWKAVSPSGDKFFIFDLGRTEWGHSGFDLTMTDPKDPKYLICDTASPFDSLAAAKKRADWHADLASYRDNPLNLESPVGHFVTAHPWISTLIGTAALGGAGWLGAYLMSRVVAPKSTAIIPSTDTTPAPKSTGTTTTSSTPTFDAAKAVTFTIPSGGKSFPLGTSFNLVDGSTGLPVTAEFEPPTGILAAGPSAGTYVCVGQGTAKFDFADGTHTTVVVTAAGTAGVSGAPKTRKLLPPVLFPFRALLQGA